MPSDEKDEVQYILGCLITTDMNLSQGMDDKELISTNGVSISKLKVVIPLRPGLRYKLCLSIVDRDSRLVENVEIQDVHIPITGNENSSYITPPLIIFTTSL